VYYAEFMLLVKESKKNSFACNTTKKNEKSTAKLMNILFEGGKSLFFDNKLTFTSWPLTLSVSKLCFTNHSWQHDSYSC